VQHQYVLSVVWSSACKIFSLVSKANDDEKPMIGVEITDVFDAELVCTKCNLLYQVDLGL